MSGFQLGEAAKRIRPDLRILYTSGFSEAALNNGIAASVGREDILSKPYRKQELAQKLLEALSRT